MFFLLPVSGVDVLNLEGYFRGKKLVLINMSATSADSSADLVIHEPIGEVFTQVMGW